MNRIRPWIAIAMTAVAMLGAGALLVTIYATLPTKTDLARMTRPLATKADVAQLATRAEQRVRVDQQLPDLVGDVSETTAAVNRVNEELYRTNAELLLLIETVEATNIELVLVIETVEATNTELLRVIETLERTNGRLEQAVDTATARLVDLQRKRGPDTVGVEQPRPPGRRCCATRTSAVRGVWLPARRKSYRAMSSTATARAASSRGTRLRRSIHARASREIQPVTSRMRVWSSSSRRAKIGS